MCLCVCVFLILLCHIYMWFGLDRPIVLGSLFIGAEGSLNPSVETLRLHFKHLFLAFLIFLGILD